MPPRATSARSKAAAAKADAATARPPPARAAATKSGRGAAVGAAAAAKTPAAKGGPKKTPTMSVPSAGRRVAKVIKSPVLVESEAEEGEEVDDVQEEDPENMEELSGETCSEEEGETEVDAVCNSSEEEDVRPQVQKTPKIIRRATKDTPAVSPGSPSPVKAKLTPARKTPNAKRTKANESGDEEESECESPTKKARVQNNSDDEVQFVEPIRGRSTKKAPAARAKKAASASEAEVSQTPRKKLPLPRRPAVKAQMEAAAKKAAAVGGKKKSIKAPDSADQVFNPDASEIDEDLYKKQTALFRNDLSGVVFEDMSEVLSEIQKDIPTDKRPSKLQAKVQGSVHFGNSESQVNSDDAMDLDNHVSDHNNIHNSPTGLPDGIERGPGVDLSDDCATDPILRETYEALPLLKTHVPDYGGYPIHSMMPGEGIMDQAHYQVHRKKLLDLILYAYDPKNDSPIVVNPARISPSLLVAGSFHGNSAKVAAFQTPSGPQRAICYSIGAVFACSVHRPTSFAKGDRQVKQILLGPLRGENERALALLGNVFDCDSLGINTFGVTAGNGEKIQGLSIRTYPSPSASSGNNTTARILPGLGFTPSKGARTGGAASSDSRPSRSLLDMRDKTTWGSNDDIAIWDARHLFAARGVKEVFKHDKVTSLKRLERDLEFGEIAMVYYSASTYPVGTEKNNFSSAVLALSLNLYGVVLLASP